MTDPMQESIDELVVRMAREATEGCCKNDEWRGRPCPYHEGYCDALDELAERIGRL